jgi:hypothetical protein
LWARLLANKKDKILDLSRNTEQISKEMLASLGMEKNSEIDEDGKLIRSRMITETLNGVHHIAFRLNSTIQGGIWDGYHEDSD